MPSEKLILELSGAIPEKPSTVPAKVLSVDIDEKNKSAMVTVPEFQLSLAIGKEGQNARLAARLTGWKIDIKSDESGKE